jgi:hypothetical protein
MVGKSEQVSIRLEPEHLQLAEEIAQRLGESVLAGSPPARAAVLRMALVRGLEVLRAELAASSSSKVRKRK